VKADTLAKHVLFSAIRITNTDPAGSVSVGTGFLFNASESPDDPQGKFIPLLVSNKHVLMGAATLRLDFLVRNADNTGPELGKVHQHLCVGPAVLDVFGHPDSAIDVAVKPLGHSIQQMMLLNPQPYFITLNWNHIPTEATVDDLDALEELTFVGFPNGIADPANHLAIMRSAITATPIAIPFAGKPTFLIDGSIFGGSSGSPVFILNRGTWSGPQGVMLGDRLHLVGIIAETLVRESDLPVQVATAPFVRISRELNLGVAYSYRAVIEAINLYLASEGLPTGVGKS
jgi:hypothetical protein